MTTKTPKTKARRRFLAAFLPALFLALLYWPIAIMQSPVAGEGWKWVQNHPALSVFQTILLPLIAGIMAAGIEPRQVREIGAKWPSVVWGLLAALLVMGVAVVVRDSIKALNDRVVEPLEFRRAADRTAFLAKHRELRRWVRADTSARCEPGQHTSAVDCYLQFTREHFDNATLTLREHGGIVAWYQKLLLVIAASTIAVFVWFLAACGFTRTRPPPRTQDALLVSLALFAVWFPVNLYSHWFTHFRTFERIEGFDAFYLGGFFFLITLIFTLLLRKREPLTKLLAAILSTGSFIVALVAKFQPQMFGRVAVIIEAFDPLLFVIVEAVLFILLLASVQSLAHDIELSQTDPTADEA